MIQRNAKLKFLLPWFATFGRLGHIFPFPGTWGSAIGCVLWMLTSPYTHPIVTIVCVCLFAYTAIYASYATDPRRKHDQSAIFIDEIAGQWFALYPLLWIEWNLWHVFASFMLFRFFDIFKMWPANSIDKNWHSSLGILLDDIVAGVYAGICIYVGLRWF